jgi:methylmalonyl-CoA mutase
VDRGLDVVVGVNAYRALSGEPTPVRVVDSVAVEERQRRRLSEVRASRDQGRVAEALRALREAAESSDNLLSASIVAMRARATLGEVSETLAGVFGRYEARALVRSGVYGKHFTNDEAFDALRADVERFLVARGRRPRILIAKIGQDGHDRGQKVVAAGLSDLGFDVDLGPLFATPDEVARQAVENDVHAVGVSTQAGAHQTLVPELVTRLAERGASDVRVVVGGVIPPQDHPALLAAGVAAVFGPGARVVELGRALLELLERRDG